MRSPWSRTTTRGQRVTTVFITCSMYTIAMPNRFTRRTSSTPSSCSTGFRPAITSSRKRTRGRSARARARSSRLRRSLGSAEAGTSASPLKPTKSSTSRAASRAAATRGVWRRAATRTFSSTVMWRKGRGDWKVRPSPTRAATGAGTPVTSRPPRRTWPASGVSMPVTVLTSVVLPEPLGPISPTISPASTWKVMPRSAWTPPKDLARPVISKSATALPRGTGPGSARGPQGRKPCGLDEDGGHEQETVQRRARSPEGAEDARAHHGARQRPHAPHNGHDGDLHRQRQGRRAVGVDEADVEGVHGPREGRERRARRQRHQLDPPGRHPQGLGGLLVVPDGPQVVSHAGPAHGHGDGQGEEHEAEGDVVEGDLRAEHEVQGALPDEGDRQAVVSLREAAEVEQQSPQDLREGDGRHGEEDAPEPEHDVPEPDGHRRRQARPHETADERRDVPVLEQQHRGVGSEGEERRVAERELPGDAPDEVPGHGQGREEVEGHPQVEEVAVAEPGGHRQASGHRQQGDPGPRRPPPPPGLGQHRRGPGGLPGAAPRHHFTPAPSRTTPEAGRAG